MVQLSFVDEGQVEEVSQFLKVLADPNRLRIFATLIQGAGAGSPLGLPFMAMSLNLSWLTS